jgi:hypothetical protein
MNEAIAKRLHDALAACNELQRIEQRHSRDEFLIEDMLISG